jgi:hypothetical protein
MIKEIHMLAVHESLFRLSNEIKLLNFFMICTFVLLPKCSFPYQLYLLSVRLSFLVLPLFLKKISPSVGEGLYDKRRIRKYAFAFVSNINRVHVSLLSPQLLCTPKIYCVHFPTLFQVFCQFCLFLFISRYAKEGEYVNLVCFRYIKIISDVSTKKNLSCLTTSICLLLSTQKRSHRKHLCYGHKISGK